MRRLVAACSIAILLSAALSIAAKKWESKPYSEWSDSDVNTVLYNSPWVLISNLVFVGGGHAAAYQVRLLTAAPIREAFLRMGAFHSSESTVSVQELEATKRSEAARLEKFLASDKGKFLTQLDKRYIVISLMITLRKESRQDELLPARFADLTPPTVLATDTGKQVRMTRFIPPGKDQLGALFFFPRKLPNGASLVAVGDKELQFKAKVKGKALTAKFSLRKMVYKGGLEY